MGSIMTTFDKREHAFEEKYVHDEELRFKARVRRDKLLGLWAAEKLGKTGPAAEDYAASLVVAEIRKDSAEQIFKTIRADFDSAGVAIPDLGISQANGGAVLGGCRGNHQRRRAGEKVTRRGLKFEFEPSRRALQDESLMGSLSIVLQRDLGRKSATFWDHAFAGRKIKKLGAKA